MKRLLALLLICLPLAGQTFILENLSNQNLDELELFEQRDTAIKQVRDLHIAGVTGTYKFDVPAEVCLELRKQLKTDYPTRARVIRAGDHTRPCRVKITGEQARFMWDGWDWNEPAGGDGTLRRVCASGCDHTTLQAALDVAVLGDLIELEPETFGGSTTGTLAVIPVTHTWTGTCPTYTVIQTAGYETNFTPGVRVSSADAANLAYLIGGTNDGPDQEHPIRFEDSEEVVAAFSSVNAGTDTITTVRAHGLNVNDEVIFANQRLVGDWEDVIEMGLNAHIKYFIKTVPTTTTFTLSKTLGGATVDITGSPASAANVGMRRKNDTISCVKMQGLRIAIADGETDTGQSIISMYDATPFPEHMMSHIGFRHLWLHGADNTTGPKRGINLNGRYLAVRDSLIEEVKLGQGSESYAIEIQNAPGPVFLENNSLSGAGMSLFIGANFETIPYVNNGSLGGIISRNDYYWKKPEWYLQRVAETPTIACLDGTLFQNHASAPTAWWTCVGGSWVAAANGSNHINYEIKNLYETKACVGCLMENAEGSLSPYGDGSQQAWLNIKMSPNTWEGWNQTQHFIGYNFRTKHTAAGFLLRGNIVPARSTFNGPYAIWNGISTDVNPNKYRYETGGDSGAGLRFGKVTYGFEVRHVTHMVGPDYAGTPKNSELYLPTEGTSVIVDGPHELTEWVSFRDNIAATALFRSNQSGFGNSCASIGDVVYAPHGEADFEDNAFLTAGAFFLSTSCLTNFYQTTDKNNFGFANPATEDYRLTSAGATKDFRAGQANAARDGKDLGVDHEVLNDRLGGADPTAGLGPWSKQYNVSITDVGTTTAKIEWDRPNAANACNLYLYSNYARTTEHADTDTAPERADTRAGNTVVAGHVIFNLGTAALTTKTWYWFEIDCPTDSIKMVGSLLTN